MEYKDKKIYFLAGRHKTCVGVSHLKVLTTVEEFLNHLSWWAKVERSSTTYLPHEERQQEVLALNNASVFQYIQKGKQLFPIYRVYADNYDDIHDSTDRLTRAQLLDILNELKVNLDQKVIKD